MKNLLPFQWRVMGKAFGYPHCCIAEFEKDSCQTTKDLYPTGPWLGTGYLPCSCCAPKAAENFDAFVAKHIDPHREVYASFPDDSEIDTQRDVDFRLVNALNEIPFHKGFIIWLRLKLRAWQTPDYNLA
jgi:hypothetical protein